MTKPVATMYVTPDRHRVIHAEILDDSQVPDDEWFDVYTAPPKKEWVGLTDEEVWHMSQYNCGTRGEFARAIEAKLKEKNSD